MAGINMQQMLLEQYGIQALSLGPVPSGWSASAWMVQADSGDYFLKVYDKHKPSTKVWVARIDSYMPVVLWLQANTGLQGSMSAPLLTKDGRYKWEDEAFLCMVFPFIHGQTIGGDKLTPEQARAIARIVAELHSHGAEIPVSTGDLLETYDISFCDALNQWMGNLHGPARWVEALTPHKDAIVRATAALQKAAAGLRQSQPPLVLCHTDIHGWNLMQADSLMLIDWEGLRLAPVEADLFSFTETFFFDYAWEEFLSVYRSVHRGFEINTDAMRFYRLRRRLEDVHAFSESILLDDLTSQDMERSLYYLNRECALLHGML